MAQYWDSKGNLHIEGAKPIPLAEQLARKAQAAITNIGNWLNESNPNSEAYKQKANTALALLTMPIGAGAKVTQTIAQPLKPYVGRQIAKTTAEGIGAGATGGAVEGFGNGLIEGENPLLLGAKGLLYGAVGGGLFGLGAGKIGQHIDFKNLYKNGTPEAFNKYFDDYIEGLNNYTKPMADYRAVQRGVRPQEGNILNDAVDIYSKGQYNNKMNNELPQYIEKEIARTFKQRKSLAEVKALKNGEYGANAWKKYLDEVPAKEVVKTINPEWEKVNPYWDYPKYNNSDIDEIINHYIKKHETEKIGHGYKDYSMSTNAANAYSLGSKPLSKWNKTDILNQLEDMKNAYNLPINIDDFSNMSTKELKGFLKKNGWHHTSKNYNITDFYIVDMPKILNKYGIGNNY